MQLVFLKDLGTPGQAGSGLTQVLRAVLLRDQVHLIHGPLPDIVLGVSRQFLEVLIHGYDHHGVVHQITAVRDLMHNDTGGVCRLLTVRDAAVFCGPIFRLSGCAARNLLQRIFFQHSKKL